MNIRNTMIHNVFFRCFINLLTAYLQSHRNILANTNYPTEIRMIIMMFCKFFANWHSTATPSEVCCAFSCCKANARVYLTKTGHGPHSYY